MENSAITEEGEKTLYQKDIKTIAKGAGINCFGEIIGTIFAFVFNLILARWLSADYVGLFFLGMCINRFVTDMSVCGFGYGILRYVSIFYQERDIQRTKGAIISGLIIVIPLSILCAIVLYSMSDTISVSFFHKPEVSSVTKIMVFAIPFAAASEVLLSSIQALRIMKYKVYVKRLIIPITQVIIFLILLSLGMQFKSALISYTVSIVLGAFFALYFFRKKFAIFDKKITAIYNFSELAKFSATRLFSQLVIFFCVWTDTFMIGYFMTSKDVGVYNIVCRLILLGTLIFYSFGTIFAPIISSSYYKKDLDSLKRYYAVVTKWAFVLTFPYYLLLILLPDYALNIFGEGYLAGINCLIILSFARIIDVLTGPCGLIITMIGKPLVNLYNELGTFVLNIILNLFLIPKYGIVGAAIATTISVTLINLIRIFEVYTILKIHPYNASYVKHFLSGLVLIGSVISAKHFIFPHCGIPFIAGITLGCLCLYFVVFRLLGLDEEDYIMLNLIRKRVSYGTTER